MIEGMGKLSYEERLEALDLPTLHERARQNDLIQVYRVMNGIDSVQSGMFTRVTEFHKKCTRNSTKDNLVVKKSNLDVRRHSFTQRVIADWNALPQEVQQASNLKQFKASLKSSKLRSP